MEVLPFAVICDSLCIHHGIIHNICGCLHGVGHWWDSLWFGLRTDWRDSDSASD